MGLRGTLPFPLVPKAVKVNYRAGRKRGQLCFSCSSSCCDKVKSVGTNRSLTVRPKISWWLAHTLVLEEKVWPGLVPGWSQPRMAPILSPKDNWQSYPAHCSTFLLFYRTGQVSLLFFFFSKPFCFCFWKLTGVCVLFWNFPPQFPVGLLFGLSSVSLLTIITASLVKRAEKSKLTLKVHYTWINPETDYHMLGWSYPCVLSRLTSVDGCWFG